ncbi:MAG: 3-oxoacyl-ACP reductase FabG [Peptoniphilus harei]|uniref:elongation factor P 5-aminopentanone reductase n=1 Tax=Peptoniphilus TaxID=162289 RepID=UPI0008DA574F|nr:MULTISPECIES: 3-oxoacyl-ACP reductase FabG [Peptoniphilus]MBS6610481.1 3-oxoacyl-ACP reductase FabG [Peptoniphilus harei]MDU5274325.1 3-oxoacyl-ACP reductase FabG [Peptoniphilus lacydonensis]
MKTVLITGASRGIGRAIAKRLAYDGYRIIINYNKSEKEAIELEREIRDMGVDAISIKADVSKSKEVTDMFKKISDKFKGVDILINNAGISSYFLFQDIDEEIWDEIFDVNVKGVYNTIHAALPYMLEKHSGKILNMSSIWGIVGGSMESHYSATKGAINALTKSLAQELGYSGITVNAIAPGAVKTSMTGEIGKENLLTLTSEIPMGRLASAEEIAELVSFMISDKNSYMTGQIISPNGGMIVY